MVSQTGLHRLSTALVDAAPGLSEAERSALRGDDGVNDAATVLEVAGRIVATPAYAGCDEDLVRALLFLQ